MKSRVSEEHRFQLKGVKCKCIKPVHSSTMRKMFEKALNLPCDVHKSTPLKSFTGVLVAQIFLQEKHITISLHCVIIGAGPSSPVGISLTRADRAVCVRVTLYGKGNPFLRLLGNCNECTNNLYRHFAAALWISSTIIDACRTPRKLHQQSEGKDTEITST